MGGGAGDFRTLLRGQSVRPRRASGGACLFGPSNLRRLHLRRRLRRRRVDHEPSELVCVAGPFRGFRHASSVVMAEVASTPSNFKLTHYQTPGRRSLQADGFCLTGDDVWSSRPASFAAFGVSFRRKARRPRQGGTRRSSIATAQASSPVTSGQASRGIDDRDATSEGDIALREFLRRFKTCARVDWFEPIVASLSGLGTSKLVSIIRSNARAGQTSDRNDSRPSAIGRPHVGNDASGRSLNAIRIIPMGIAPIRKYSYHRKKERFQFRSGAQYLGQKKLRYFNNMNCVQSRSGLGALIAISPKKTVGGVAYVALAAAPDRTGAAADR